MPQGKYTIAQPIQQTQGKYRIAETPTDVRTSVTPKPVIDVAKTVGANLPSKETLISGAGGAGATYLTGSPLIGSATMSGLDQLLHPENWDKTAFQNVTDMFKNTAMNELLGGVFSAGGKVGREIYKPGSTFAKAGTPAAAELKELLGYKPTAGQLSGNRILNTIEDTFAGKRKEAALEESAKLVNSRAEEFIKRLTGRSDISLNTPFKQAINIQKGIENQFDSSMIESTRRGVATKLIAEANPENIPIYSKISAGPINTVVQTGTYLVKGRTTPKNYLQTAQNILDSLNKSDSVPNPDSPLMKDLVSIIDKNSAIDATGKPVPKPRSFGDMWESKQDFGNKAFSDPKTKIDKSNKYYTELYNAITKDIQDSIPVWKNSGADASRLFEESRRIVAKRHELFDKAPIEKLVNEVTEPVPAIDKIIANPTQLKKTLILGHLQIPDDGGFKYITSNTRKDLQGYELQSLLNKATYKDANNQTLYDGQKLMDMFADPTKQESYRALYSAQNRADIEQFFKNINKVSQKGQTGMGNYWMMRLGGAGLTFGAGLLSGLGTISSGGLGVMGGSIGLNQLGKLLTDKRTARLMVSMANDGPLNMPTQAAGRLIAHVLRNTPMTLQYQDGNSVEGKIDSQGQFTIPVK